MQRRLDLIKMSQRAPRQWQVRFSNENACPGSIGTKRTRIRLTRRQLTARAASPGESPTDVRFGSKVLKIAPGEIPLFEG